MSNVIKAYSVRYDERTKRTIDTHFKETDKKEQVNVVDFTNNQQDGFVGGLKAVVVEQLESVSDKQFHTNIADNNGHQTGRNWANDGKIIEDAKKEADRIIEQAKKEAQKIKDEVFTNAQKKGYDEGKLQAKKEAQKQEAEYALQLQRLNEERQNIYNSLEPQIAGIIAELVEKITGIIIEDKDEVILYLVEKAVRNLDKCNEFNIKVSNEDYEFVALRKDLLLHAIGREVAIYITEDPSLKKNQCLIETETKVINCSLDIQLINLINDIKLIGSI